MSYFDFRFNTPDPATLRTDQWVVHCHPASDNCASAASWNEESPVTPASFDVREAPYARGYFLGEYMGLADAKRRHPVGVRVDGRSRPEQHLAEEAGRLARG